MRADMASFADFAMNGFGFDAFLAIFAVNVRNRASDSSACITEFAVMIRFVYNAIAWNTKLM